MQLQATLASSCRRTAGAVVKGQESSCDIVPLTKCHNVPGVSVTDRGPYLAG